MWNKLQKNLTSGRVFYLEIFALSIFFLIILSLLLQVTFFLFIKILIGVTAVDILVIYFIGRKRNKEMAEIKSLINSIRKNKFEAADEIHLSSGLYELEDEIKKMFVKTKSDIENLKKLERIRTEFLGNVSHELRTPIFGIQGYLETLLNGAINDDSVKEKFVSKAARHAENLNTLLNDLIDISMIESGQMKMSFRYFNAQEYFQSIVEEMKVIAEEKGIKLLLGEIRPKLQLFGDKIRLRQVMVNLISNAIKYTDKGSVTVTVEEEESDGRVIVQDTGIGISEDNLSRIFERFYRIDKDRSREIGGTGLGLAIVKHILEAHNSKIMVESKLGEGSRFSFKLKK
ncbi:MAG: ATP-binding protein [Melioribacteraceae bacterium]|nr:ATP-binding protein [Melioribacteraceae bacterium]